MNREWELVRNFMAHTYQPVAECPEMLKSSRSNLRAKWMIEEILEFTKAESVYEQADAIMDLIYFSLGTLVEMGVPPQPLFDVIHDANMRKRLHNGSIVVVDNKVAKPPEWRHPWEEIKEIIDARKSCTSKE